MLSRIAQSVVSLVAAMIVFVACSDGQTPAGWTAIPVHTPIVPSASVPAPSPFPAHPTEPIPATENLPREISPCTPAPGYFVDPCDPDAPPFQGAAAQSLPDLGSEPLSIREMLDDAPPPPAWVPHLVLRGTYLPGTVRCTAVDPFRPTPYLRDELDYETGPRSVKCYVDARSNAYVLGSGPSTLTVMVFRWIYWEGSYDPFTPYVYEGQTEQELIEEDMQRIEGFIRDLFVGREHIVFLGPDFDLSSEAWRALGTWDVQRRDDGTVVAVHPRRDLWASIRPDDYQTHLSTLEMPLPAFTQAVTTAHQARVAEYGGRIGADANLPKLVGNANQLRQYYTEVGAYAPGVPTPAPPPPLCGLAKSDQAGLLRDCKALLAAKDTLRGTATLNWSADTAITSWDGVTVDGTPSRVTEIRLREKGLTGAIPTEFANLTALKVLRLGDNRLTGSIPPELGSLTALADLRLYSNRLSGGIPTELGSLSNLVALHLDDNQLTGPIPSELGSLANLRDLFLGKNQLTGAIPTQLGSLSNLRFMNLDDNQLTGGIPTQMGSLTNLQDLSLSGNQLTGSIPTQLGDLTKLRDLFLNDNQMTGSIPTQLGKLAALELLELSGNGLTGTIPTQLGKLSKLESLYLRNNALTGAIPTQLGSLSNLEVIWLSGNTLTGCIPAALSDIDDHDLAKLKLQYCPAPEA